MDFKNATKLSTLISKDYAEDFFKILVMYKSISSSEAASRLNLHIKTAQDFLEGLSGLDIVSKEEVYEKKRPYYRYTLEKIELSLTVDLMSLYNRKENNEMLECLIREKNNSGANFKTTKTGDGIASVHMFVGEGRSRKEKVMNLTKHQGLFLYHLPFPTEDCVKAGDIINRYNISNQYVDEILDMLNVLNEYGMLDIKHQ